MRISYTVSDVYNTFQKGLECIGGSGGMAREVEGAGYLDYEADPDLKDKYQHSNFYSGQLVITTFSVAKNNPYLILDAVKHLIEKNCSALIIKNVFHLPVHESVIRYANARNFPIFVISSGDVYVEDIIYEISRRLDGRRIIREKSDALNRILRANLNPAEVRENAWIINPSAEEQYYTLYALMDEYDIFSSPGEYEERFFNSRFNVPENVLLPCRSGYILIFSRKMEKYVQPMIQEIFGETHGCIGISNLHLTLEELGQCLRESFYAASLAKEKESVVRYRDLGILRCILPFARQAEMEEYAENILRPVIDYGIENNAPLYETLVQYIRQDCNMTKTAEIMHQHKNTIRYRLERIAELTGMDHKQFSAMEELALAVHLWECREKI